MSGDIANPRVWQGADFYVAPLGTTPPNDVTTPWAAPWRNIGLLADDGATESRSQDSTDHFGWGGLYIRTTHTKFKRTLKVTALEDNAVVWALVNPGSTADTDETGLTTRTYNVPTVAPMAFGMETRDGDITRRKIIPSGEVSTEGDVTISSSEMAQFVLTITVAANGAGEYGYDLTDDPQAADDWS